MPASLRHEHARLQGELEAAQQAPGRTGEAARAVERIMRTHFLREAEYATPPLSLLGRLARGRATEDMAWALPLVDRLKAELPLMLEEHRAIEGALDLLETAALAEGRPEFARFAERLKLHARLEEDVLYPAAILVGEYLRLVLEESTLKQRG